MADYTRYERQRRGKEQKESDENQPGLRKQIEVIVHLNSEIDGNMNNSFKCRRQIKTRVITNVPGLSTNSFKYGFLRVIWQQNSASVSMDFENF